jgi:hypothetical protein
MEQTSANIIASLAIWGSNIIIEVMVGEELEQEYGVIPNQYQFQHR